MKTPKKSNVKLFVKDLTEFLATISRECNDFVVNSSFNNKTVVIRYSKGGNDVQR